MIPLKNSCLSQVATDQLKRYQQEITALGGYEAQVKNSTWNGNKTGFNEVKATLQAMAPGIATCHYCGQQQAATIDHFYPQTLYPELTYIWENYLWACGVCNGSGAKGNHFAIFDMNGFQDVTRPRNAPIIPPIIGDRVLINPRFENPLNYLQVLISDDPFQFLVDPVENLSHTDYARAVYTINTLFLNRPLLVEARRAMFYGYLTWLDGYEKRKVSNPNSITQHKERLHKGYQYHAVWEEMRRIYIDRDPAHWPTLIAQNPNTLGELDRYFSQNPEVLDISFMPV